MRKHIFRAMLKSGCWLYWNEYGELTTEHGKRHAFEVINRTGKHLYYHVHELRQQIKAETVGMWSGLADKNGKKIFEDDIIQMNCCPEDIAQVCFGEFNCIDMETGSSTDRIVGWFYKVIPTDELSRIEPFSLPFQMNTFWAKELSYEVIGNIHDNPELLEGANGN